MLTVVMFYVLVMVTAVMFQILVNSHVNICTLSGTDDQPCNVSGWWTTMWCFRYWWTTMWCFRYWWTTMWCFRYWWTTMWCFRYWWSAAWSFRYWWSAMWYFSTGDQPCDVSGTGDLVIECRQLWLSVLKLLCTLLQTQSAATLQCLTDVLNSIWIDFCGRWNRNSTL